MGRPRALLTGRNGFTGRYVALELEKAGYEVIGLATHLESDAAGSTVVANLLDRGAVAQAVADAKADVVLHLAAVAFVAHGDVEEMYRVNVIGTRNLLEALAGTRKQPGLVVLASSANVYGNADVDPITEHTPPAPANDYAVSKLAMEYMAKLWTDRLPITITRPFNYTGVGQTEQFLIPKIVGHFARRSDVIQLGNTDVVRDFSDVRDVAAAYVRILKSGSAGKTFNLCSGKGRSLAYVIREMAKISGHQLRIEINPDFVRRGEVFRLVGSSSLVGELGQRIHDLTETLTWMYQSAVKSLDHAD
ncbi:MAG TPA: NAD-dependent epimerase/dehydratase family protein [Frateuria sp.]|uniref:NAD-dependent epimerase/dehydratase family protein n=1 Tax=Frateuria sp. TaxID=2211372 RepID=UPI002D8046DE|nr:NAD-dependent epimerase/dehydratase family protein [Frateuria sp.]HET6805051.1 NAD-dependent epimerase/dehydratase family protein [Frateuria sp.]